MSGVENVDSCWMLCVLTAWPVASFAAYIPFRNLLGVDVIPHRMASVACRTSWPLHVVGRIILGPPVRARADEVLAPLVILGLPLAGQREVVVPHFRKVSLFPKTTVDES